MARLMSIAGQTQIPGPSPARLPARLRISRALGPYLFILPKLIVFAVFLLYPVVRAITLSLQSGAILSGLHWTGIRNYIRLIHDDLFWTSLKNTVYYTALVIPSVLIVGIGLAVILNRPIRFRPLFLLLLVVPSVASTVAASVIWAYLLQVEGGLFNTVLGVVGIGPVNWLGNPRMVIPVFVALEVWRGAGFYTILFLAAMQSIPLHLYDAAAIDGANAWQSFRLVTLPLLRPTLLFAAVMATIWNLQLFDSPYVMTRGGPGYASTTVVMYIYQQAFRYDQMGLAAAMAIVLLLIIMVLAVAQLTIFRRDVQF
ncbi:MAG: sugar ABC transporter permease [Thermomicrobiales bacterium]